MSENTNELPIGDVANILARKQAAEKTVQVPEWDCSVKVKGLSKAEQIMIRKQAVRGTNVDEEKMEGLLFVYGVVEPKFKPEHISQIFEMPSGPVDKVIQEIMALSGMTEEAEKEAEADFQQP